MDEQLPWTGGISNRQILADSLRGLIVVAAIGFSLLALALWITGHCQFLEHHVRGPLCAAIAGPLAVLIARWCLRT